MQTQKSEDVARRKAAEESRRVRLLVLQRVAFAAVVLLSLVLGVTMLSVSATHAHSLHNPEAHTQHSAHIDGHRALVSKQHKQGLHKLQPRKAADAHRKYIDGEQEALQKLRELADAHLVAHSKWLPRRPLVHDADDAAADAPPAAAEGVEDKHAHRRRTTHRKHHHFLDLTKHAERVSHDTFYLGEHEHPSEPNQKLQGYAFVHYHGNSARAKAKAQRESVEHAKHTHFNRSVDENGGALQKLIKHAAPDKTSLSASTQSNTLAAALLHTKAKTKRSHDDDDDEDERSEEETVWEHIRCAAPIRHGARMRHTSGYFLHTDNNSGLSARSVMLAVEAAMDSWRCVFKRLDMEIMGPLRAVFSSETATSEDERPPPIAFDRPTGENHIGFGILQLPDGEEDQTLGVTVSFGVFNAERAEDRFLSEFKTLYNDEYVWGICTGAADDSCRARHAIDVQSIAVHEAGHGFGLDDLYDSACREQTMYWSSPPADIGKRTLEDDDAEGMLALYR